MHADNPLERVSSGKRRRIHSVALRWYDPNIETRNRKPLKRPVIFGAKWELRFGPNNRYRDFYRVDYGSRQVILLAIGEKSGDRLLIGGEEIEI